MQRPIVSEMTDQELRAARRVAKAFLFGIDYSTCSSENDHKVASSMRRVLQNVNDELLKRQANLSKGGVHDV